jgi:hypothetical protein
VDFHVDAAVVVTEVGGPRLDECNQRVAVWDLHEGESFDRAAPTDCCAASTYRLDVHQRFAKCANLLSRCAIRGF